MQDPLETGRSPVAPIAPRWMRVLLALSLAVNLLIVGAVGATLLLHGPRDADGARHDRVGGPLTRALTSQDRRAIGRALWRDGEDRAAREAGRKADYARLLGTLRQEPFDAETAEAAVAGLLQQAHRREEIARTAMIRRLAEMAPEGRRAYADRLEAALDRPRR